MRLAVVVALAIPLAAHDLYLMPGRFTVKPGQTLQIAIHSGDAFPESENAPVMARLRDVKLAGTSATGLRDAGKKAAAEVAIASPGSLILTTRTIANFIEMKPEEFDKYLHEEGLEEIRQYREKHGEAKTPGRERYAKFAKAIITSGAPDEGYRKAVGFAIEIIPEQSPATVRAGGELPVQILLHGKPAAGLAIEAANESETKVVGRADAAGRIRIPITRAGRWRIHALAMQRAKEPKGSGDASADAKSQAADWESFWASLTFEIRP